MISREQAERLKGDLLAMLAEDAHNAERIAARLDGLTRERGVDAHAALLMVLCRLPFPEDEARRHWEAIVRLRAELSAKLGREIGLRVAVLDHFVHANRRMPRPTLIELEMLESLEKTSGLDPVTGLHNDRAYRSAVQGELRRARRFRSHVSVVLFDLDDFERVNEVAGRLVGDRILRELAILLKNKSRDIDFAARPGEDEFALLLPETDRGGALLVAERFRQEVDDHFRRREIAGEGLPVTVSAGVATYPADARSPEDLIGRAAQALYRAKAEGKNAVQVWSPERRRYLRFDLEPGRFEVEVLAPEGAGGGDVVNMSRNGIVFASPEPLHVGERIEIRLQDPSRDPSIAPLRVRGQVVRLEQLPVPDADDAEPGTDPDALDRFEVGVALDTDVTSGGWELLDFLERAHADLGRREPS